MDTTLRTDFRVGEIRQQIIVIQQRMINMKEQGIMDPFDYEMDILTNLPHFYKEHPFIVKRIVSGQDLSYLYKMLDSLEKVQNGTASLSGTEMTLGNELAEKYLYPHVKK
jgi:hypothetical protein